MRSLLKEYRELAWNEVGTPPSGADVVSQILGGVSYIYPHHFLHRELSWSCVDLGFLLLATGAKEATHTHLETLDHLDVEDLADCVELVAGALERSDSGNLISGINEYAEMLRFKNLVSRNTLDLISQAFRWPGVVAAKGCGALGADVILVVYEINKAFDLLYHVERSSMTVLSGHEQISEGWRFEGYRAVDKKYE
jgi:mevalonate kinase